MSAPFGEPGARGFALAVLVCLVLGLVVPVAAGAEVGRKQLVEYVEWRFHSSSPLEDAPRWARQLRSFLMKGPAAMTEKTRRRSAWVLIGHEWQLLQAASGGLAREAAVFRLRRAVEWLERALGAVPSPEWIGRLTIAQGYLSDRRVTRLSVTVQDPAGVRNDVRRALADEIGPSQTTGANGVIQQQFRDAFGDAVRSLGQAVVTRRLAAEAMGSLYGRSAPDAPANLGTLEKRALYAPGEKVRTAVAEILREVFPEVDPSRELPSLLVQYAEMRGGLSLEPEEDPQILPQKSFVKPYPGLSPEQTDRRLRNNERDRSFRELLAKLEPLMEAELDSIRAIADPVPAEDLLPYEPLRAESVRVAESHYDTGDVSPFWRRRFELMEELYGDPSMLGPRREVDTSEPPRLLTSEQRGKLDEIFGLVNRVLTPEKLSESPDQWVARFLAESAGGAR